MPSKFLPVVVAVFSLSFTAAHADALGQHPAVQVKQQAVGIDANRFIVAHPAGLALVAGHANHAHPAVTGAAAARGATPAQVDPNTFVVQPPAATTWALVSAADLSASRVASAAVRPLP